MRQCFALEYRKDGEWKIAFLVIETRAKIESDLPRFSAKTGVALEDMRLRWIWTVAQANKLREEGIAAYGESGDDVLWLG